MKFRSKADTEIDQADKHRSPHLCADIGSERVFSVTQDVA